MLDKRLLLIILLSFLLRLAYVLTLGDGLLFPDSVRYDGIARSLLAGRDYPGTFTAPLYPLFLTAVYSCFGHSFTAVRILQALMQALTMMPVYLLGKNIFSQKTALYSCVLLAVYPFFIYLTGLMLTETLFIFLLACFTYHLYATYKLLSFRHALCAGFMGGACIMVKPVMFYFIILAPVVLTAIHKRTGRLFARGAVIIAVAAILMLPWGLSNLRKHGVPVFLTTGGGLTFYESNNPRATGGPGVERIEWTEEMKGMDAIQLDRHFKREAVRYIINNPGRFLRLALIKQARFWSPIPNAPEFQTVKYSALGFFPYFPLLILAAWQTISMKGRKHAACIFLPIIFFALLHTVLLGSIRYRVPIDSFIIILASEKLAGIFGGKQPA